MNQIGLTKPMVVAESVAATSDLATAEYGTAARAAGAERVSADRRLETKDILSLRKLPPSAARALWRRGKKGERSECCYIVLVV